MKNFKYLSLIVVGLIAMFAFTGCRGPAEVEVVEEIDTNETAFVVPMEGANMDTQGKFMSVDFLEDAKVAAKRVTIPLRKRKNGRRSWNFEWIPTVRVIKVDRKPVTREWTQDSASGTSNANEAIHVESKESIGFAIGVNITSFVREDDAATFLYWYAGKPLSAVVDENVRGYVTSILSREFGSLELVDGRGAKAEIFDRVYAATREHFKETGITIDNLGYAEGLIYEDEEIQTGINNRFLAELSVQTAAQNKLAQDELNKQTVATATASRKAAEEFARAQDAAIMVRELDIQKIQAEAQKIAAEKWNGSLPANIMPDGSGWLMNLNGKGGK
ncbi:hypothetical protein HOB10_00420 [Candidatus Parcubacteria bacterium]|jgi:hypothetical protein|nr:hypothetical protein [Candidatus Parcubacteria bacterium]